MHEFFSLGVQISRFCANSAKFCAVARPCDRDIQKLWMAQSVPSCAVFLGLSLALRSHDQFQASHWYPPLPNPPPHPVLALFSGFSTSQRFQHFLVIFALSIGFITFQRFQHFFSGYSTFQRFQHILAVLALFNGFLNFLAVLALFRVFSTCQRFQHFIAILVLFSGFSTFNQFYHFLAVLALSSG